MTPSSPDSSGDYYGFDNDGSAWTIKEFGTKDNAFSLCTFIGNSFLRFSSIRQGNRYNINLLSRLLNNYS